MSQVDEKINKFSLRFYKDPRIRDYSVVSLPVYSDDFIPQHKFNSRLRELRQELNNGTIQPGTKAYEKRLELITKTGITDHKNLSNGQAKAYLNFSQQMDAVKSTV